MVAMIRASNIFCLALTVPILTGCMGLHTSSIQENVSAVTGPAPTVNTTPMHEVLSCLGLSTKNRDFRLGVSEFADGTGAMEGDAQNSRALTQRPDMMMTVALARGGVHLVNRNSIAVVEWELRNAMEKKLGEGRAINSDNQKVDFRPVKAGAMLGSTHYVSGAITEINWNIASAVAEAGAYSAFAGRRTYRISVAVDVLVTNTITTEIVHARSYKKQLVGFEVTAGLFRFVQVNPFVRSAALATMGGLELFSANVGQKQNEPVQTAVRWIIELAAYDVIRSLTGRGEECDKRLPPDTLEIQPARQSMVSNAPDAPSSQAGATVSPRTARSTAGEQRQSTAVASASGTEREIPTGGSRQVPQSPAPKLPMNNTNRADPEQNRTSSARPSFAAEIGSASTEPTARLSRTNLQARFSEQLGRQRLDIVRVEGPEPYRVRVSRLSRDMAGIVCFRIKVAGGRCDIIGQNNEAALRRSSGGRT